MNGSTNHSEQNGQPQQQQQQQERRRSARGPPPRPYLVLVSHRFIVLTLLAAILVAFAIGRVARVVLLEIPQRTILEQQQKLLADVLEQKQGLNQQQSSKTSLPASAKQKATLKLPTPVLPAGKVLPRTRYTSKNFNTAKSVTTNSRWVLAEEGAAAVPDSCQASGSCGANANETADNDEIEDEEHMPAGQHLLVDIDHVDSEFLNSEERLAGAMIQLVNQCGLTLLSYHCHQLDPKGVSCVGVLLESHVSFHTWPSEGVITLDLFTCGDGSLLPFVPLVKNLFALPESSVEDPRQPDVMWAYKPRGFDLSSEDNVAYGDLYETGITVMTRHKNEVREESG